MAGAQVALITGASSGIGEAMAREYARRGSRLALLARREDRLSRLVDEVGGRSQAIALSADVTRDGDVERSVEAVLDRFGRIDVVIANAGFSVAGPLEKLKIDDYRRQFETNVFGVLRTIYASLDALKVARGKLGVVGSVSGYLSTPGISAYAMSKYAVRALCESLDAELAPSGVSVTHIAPGFVASEIRQVDNEGRHRPDRRDFIPSWLVMGADRAAREIVTAVEKRRREVVVTGHGKAAVSLARHAPSVVAAALRRAPTRPPKS